jgi:Flp pilus assembly pilin Flp
MDRIARRVSVRLIRFPKEEGGAVMVEFAIIAPFFFFMIFGCIQLMGVAHADAMLQYANYMGLRAGSVHFEPVEKGFSKDGNIENVMREAVRHALGPLSWKIAEYPGPSGAVADRAISTSPVEIFEDDIKVVAGVIDLGADHHPGLRKWLTARTEVKVRMGIPWIGRVLQAIQLRVAPYDHQAEAQKLVGRGIDPFATIQEPPGMAPVGKISWLTLRSDAYLDNRAFLFDGAGQRVPRTFSWPLSTTNGTVQGTSGPITYDLNEAHPAAFPIQRRFRD